MRKLPVTQSPGGAGAGEKPAPPPAPPAVMRSTSGARHLLVPEDETGQLYSGMSAQSPETALDSLKEARRLFPQRRFKLVRFDESGPVMLGRGVVERE